MVFVRPGYLRKALWADIDLEAAEWRFLVTKAKTQHIVPSLRAGSGNPTRIEPPHWEGLLRVSECPQQFTANE
jgi:hypothetical protein